MTAHASEAGGAAAHPLPSAREAARDPAIDIARGLAIILVVWGHSIIGVQRAMGPGEAGRFAILLIYSVHMPVFFFVSGLLSRSALAEPFPAFARRLAGRMAYPYLLWSALLLTAHFLMSDLTNTEVPRLDLPSILYRPPAVMWFLYALAFGFLVARALRRAPPVLRLAVGCGFAAGGYSLDLWLLPYLRYVGIFLIATELTPRDVTRAVRNPRLVALAGAALLAAAGFALRAAAGPPLGYPAAELRYLPAAAGGIVLILAAAQALAAPARGPGALLAFVGTRTMPIFVTHILVVAAVRIALVRLGVGSSAAVIGTATAAGVLLPIAAYATADRLSLARLLGWK